MKTKELVAIASLIIGAALLTLAAYIPSVPHDYTWNVVALALGLVLVIWALGTLLPGRVQGPGDRKFITLLLSGLVMAALGADIMIFTPVLRIVFSSDWWIYTLAGAVLFICGIILGTWSWVHRARLDG